MKKSVMEFLKANGFYLSFGVGVVALVVALAVYNVNTNKEEKQNQEINLNEPAEQEIADAEGTEEVQETILDGDMDVPMDMWSTRDVAEADTEETEEDTVAGNTEESGEDVEAVISNQAAGYEPVEGLAFSGVEEVTMPVLGNTILPYSMDTTVYFQTLGTYRCNPGMLLQAPSGTEVASIWHGQVIEKKHTKEYGTMVTVDLGSGYTAIYGQLEDVRVDIGDEVWKDTILGVVAEPTAYYEKEGSHLYFEVRKDGETINPMEILQVE
ncbi:MAG: M23 family metallopeptidase [Lachnospiraceae bacterium]|nr:M23 family metallopeptidase [Lachnospiraceae bacterium]